MIQIDYNALKENVFEDSEGFKWEIDEHGEVDTSTLSYVDFVDIYNFVKHVEKFKISDKSSLNKKSQVGDHIAPAINELRYWVRELKADLDFVYHREGDLKGKFSEVNRAYQDILRHVKDIKYNEQESDLRILLRITKWLEDQVRVLLDAK